MLRIDIYAFYVYNLNVKYVLRIYEVVMKKYILIVFSCFIFGFICCYFMMNDKVSNSVLASEAIPRNNALTMMLETDVDSNEYEVAMSNEWPTERYIFNAEMSACERGGTLSWDSENNRVLMASGSADKCYVYFDRYTAVRITNVTASNITNSSITLTVEATAGENSIATYYFSSNDGVNYEESSSNTYTFSNLSTGTEYNFKVYAVDSNGVSSNIYTLSESTLSTVYLADYIKNTVYTGDGNNGLYYHDGLGSYTNAAQEAGDNSYRYAGANPNNYVCFGSDAATCPNDNLYRIIGVFGSQVKLIKNTSIGGYYWSGSISNRSNVWSNSTLNTGTLNGTYLNGLGTTWNEMIETTTWKVGGNMSSNIEEQTVKNTFINEIVSPAANTTYSAKIGLMYVSDYGYAASPANWTTNLESYNNSTNTSNNWLYLGAYEWTISRISNSTDMVFGVLYSGCTFGGNVTSGSSVRPSFYLKSNVGIISGDGSSTNPYRVALA